MHISALHIYPVKSCRGLTLETSEYDSIGLLGDRRAMLVKPDGTFITQRTHAKMAQIQIEQEREGFSLYFNGNSYPARTNLEQVEVTVWKDTVKAIGADGNINDAVSKFLDEAVELVFLYDGTNRQMSGTWASGLTSFADSYPILIANTASLKALEGTAGVPLQMAQFRPNIIVETDTAWIEDSWKTIEIDDQVFDIVKPCTRCIMTTLDPKTGNSRGNETMQAMIKTRRSAIPNLKGVLFGVNAVPRGTGHIKLGQTIKVLESRTPWAVHP